MAIDFYYMIESPPCRTVLMVAKHLDIDLNLKSLNLHKGEHLNEQFVKLNPFHCVPTIDDNGFVLWESRAIITYLINSYKPCDLYPIDVRIRANIDRLMQFDLGVFYKNISQYLNPLFNGGKIAEEKNCDLRKGLDLLESMVTDKTYVNGNDLTVADLTLLSSISLLESADYDLSEWVNIDKWLINMKALPYYGEINNKAIDNIRQYMKLLLNKS